MRAKIHNYSDWIGETSPEALKSTYTKLLNNAGFEVINYTEKHFKPFGYTALFLLAESHLAIHTFPEHNTTYIELSSCVAKPFYKFIKSL